MVVVASFVVSSCGGAQHGGVNWEMLGEAVELRGDLRCQGRGSLEILDFLAIEVEGGAGAIGTLDATGDGSGALCAGLRLSLGPLLWAWVSHHQSLEPCKAAAGKLERLDKASTP